MFSRILFLLLLAANVGIGAWLYLAPRAPVSTLPAVDPGVARLTLLSERDGNAQAAIEEIADAPVATREAAQDRCLRVGPFPSQADLRRAMTTLTPQKPAPPKPVKPKPIPTIQRVKAIRRAARLAKDRGHVEWAARLNAWADRIERRSK